MAVIYLFAALIMIALLVGILVTLVALPTRLESAIARAVESRTP